MVVRGLAGVSLTGAESPFTNMRRPVASVSAAICAVVGSGTATKPVNAIENRNPARITIRYRVRQIRLGEGMGLYTESDVRSALLRASGPSRNYLLEAMPAHKSRLMHHLRTRSRR